jgi:hypothetical protein
LKPVVDAVASLLSSEDNAEKSAEEIATEIVDGIFRAINRAFKQPPPPLVVGMVYSFPWSPAALSLIWQEGGARWFMGRSSEYGLMIQRADDTLALKYRKLSRAAFLQPDSDRYIVGDWVQCYGAKAHRFKVVAVAQSTALLEGPKGTYTAFPFKELDKGFRFYRKRERTTDA